MTLHVLAHGGAQVMTAGFLVPTLFSDRAHGAAGDAAGADASSEEKAVVERPGIRPGGGEDARSDHDGAQSHRLSLLGYETPDTSPKVPRPDTWATCRSDQVEATK